MSEPDIDADITDAAPRPRRRRKLIALTLALVVLTGGIGGGLYAAGVVGGHDEVVADTRPKLIPKGEQKRVAAGEGEGEGSAASGRAQPGAERYASNYFAFDKNFTANISDSDRLVQVGLALSTPYDDTVIENIRTNEIAVRSAILLALGDTNEDELATERGKRALQARLGRAINATLKEKEGFGGVGNVYFTNFVVQ